jgi:outer membrane receptor protein involved in Fe transport
VQSTKAGNDGTYHVQELQPGRYSVLFEKSGFAKYDVTDAIVLVGRTLKVDAALTLGTTTQTVTVTEAPALIDTASTMVAHNVPSEEFNLLPKPRDFQALAVFSPSVNTGIIEGGFQVNGASGAENNYYIDGVSTTSLIDGSARQTAVFEHLAEVQVKTAGIEAEYGGALGGVVSAITKSGGNKFHGDIHYYYFGNAISAAPTKRMQVDPSDRERATFTYFQDEKQKRDNHEVGGSLGGPFIKNKLYFFTSASPRWHRAENKYTFSDGPGSMQRKAHAMSWFNRLDFDPSSRVRTNFTWMYTPTYQTGGLYAYTGYCATCSVQPIAYSQKERDRAFNQPEQSYTGTIDFVLSNSSVLSVKGGRYYLNYKEVDVPYTSMSWWRTSSVGLAGVPPELQQPYGYTTPSSAWVEHDLTTRTYVQADFSQFFHAGGQHNFKFGIGTQKNVNNVIDHWFGSGGRTRLYWDTTYRGDRGQYGYYFTEDGYTRGATGAHITHLYVQDAWRVHPRLTLNLGLRTERETIPSFLRSEIPYAFKFGWGDKLAPRLGASWDVLGNGKVKISGAWGRYFDWTKYELARGTFGADFWHLYYRSLDTLDIFSINLNNLPGRNIWPSGEFRDYRLSDFSALDPNVKPMSVDQFNIGVEYEIRPQTVFSARYVRSKLNRTIEDLAALDANGNEVYGYGNPGEGKFEFGSVSTQTCSVTLSGGACSFRVPKGTRTYDALQLQLTRRFSGGWLANASYVYSRLYGNYSGLQSTDEIRPPTLGAYMNSQAFASDNFRGGGNANRAWDLDEIMFDAHGNAGVFGLLPTDRPHVFKFYGAYNFKFGTEVGTFFRLSSGTPVSTVVSTLNSIQALAEGRGDLGRTPTFNQTDLLVAHEVKLGEVKKLRFEFNMMNLFNQKTNMYTYDRYNQEEVMDSVGLDLSGVDLSKGYDWKAMAAQASADAGFALDPRYKKAAVFNPGFSGRFLIKFIF